MSFDKRRQLEKRLESKEFRDALVDAEIANGVAFQLKVMQRERGWTQQELAERAGTAQPLISKYLGGYERYSLQTLKKLASALDVALIVRFAPFSELVEWSTDLTPERLAPLSFSQENQTQILSTVHYSELPLAVTTAVTTTDPISPVVSSVLTAADLLSAFSLRPEETPMQTTSDMAVQTEQEKVPRKETDHALAA